MKTFLSVIAFVAVTACGADGVTGVTQAQLSGTYSVNTVNGAPVPTAVSTAAGLVTLLTDQITIAENGTWAEVYTYRVTNANGSVSNGADNDGGTYTLTGRSVAFHSTSLNGTVYTGTSSGNYLTLNDGANTYVFTK